jgi:hypothetical protein
MSCAWYRVASIEPEFIDGKGVIEFMAAAPENLAWFRLADRPGRALTEARYVGPHDA